jgi:DNA-binding transcriptional MerR regulator
MDSCSYSAPPRHGEAKNPGARPAETQETEYSITDVAKEYGVTLRALRFYESRGLLSPERYGRRRIFRTADCERLALILKWKALGFTLSEIIELTKGEARSANPHDLKISPERCAQQIAFFERQVREATEALAELRRIQALLA